MNIERKRQIDYYLGIPLLFLVSLWGYLKRLFMPARLPDPRKILFVELSEMGSAILAEPAIKKIQQCYDASLYFCIFERNVDCLQLLNLVAADSVYVIRDDNPLHFLMDSFRFRGWCRKREIDTLVDLELFSRYSALLTAWSGAGNRLGFHACHNEGLYRGNVHTHRHWYNPHLHIAQNYLALVQQLSCVGQPIPYAKTKIESHALKISRLELNPADQLRIQRQLDDQIGGQDWHQSNLIIMNLSVGGEIAQRCWPRTHFINLIQRVLAFDARAMVLISGAKAAYPEAETVRMSIASDRCVNIAGIFAIPELPYLYALAKLMVSSDCGPAHFAAVTDMPVIVLFGPETPALYRPLGKAIVLSANLACSPCVSAANHRKSACMDNQCMKMITPEQVFSEVQVLYDTHEVISVNWKRKA